MPRNRLTDAVLIGLAATLLACGSSGRGGGGPGGEETVDLRFSFPETDSGASAYDLTYSRNRDAACAQVRAEATIVKKPVDIIFVIDNSGSMTDEIVGVEKNVNKNFAEIIGKSGLDYRVIMVSRHGTSTPGQSICIEAPLSGIAVGGCANPPGQPKINPPRFFHYSIEIYSTDSFKKILSSYNTPDEFNLAPMGWSQWLRKDAIKVFIEITDDRSAMPFGDFEQQLFAKMPKMFGDANKRNYIFHTIAGLKQNNPPTKPWLPKDPIQAAMCTGSAVYSNAVNYQELSVLSGGLRFPICQHANFDAVFKEVATGVIQGAKVVCEFEVPKPPEMQEIDYDTIIVEYNPGNGGASEDFHQVLTANDCVQGKFYIDNERIYLCPDTCRIVQNDEAAKLRVLFDCVVPLM